jgi:hypothetical protein
MCDSAAAWPGLASLLIHPPQQRMQRTRARWPWQPTHRPFPDDDGTACEQGKRHPADIGPMTLYALRMMPDGRAFVLTSWNARAEVPSAKHRFPVPNRIG